MLLAVHLFNIAGYTLLFDYFIQQSDRQFIQQLDNNQYNDSELIEVKIALHTPYLTSWSDYERIDGEAEVNGVYYNYVKRKIYNDTLYLLCLPNKNKTQLNAARIDYANKVNDVPANADDTGALKKNPAGSEYQQPLNQFTVSLPATATGKQMQDPASSVLQSIITGPFHPPQG
ncbi:hypothetical protein FAM09_14215 [Niastella caeni]|uniref:Uncharacterized protein n=1 Tax=Niastella caeni TaxID=2569763 RepID=A0A4S8HVJ1_9BACT|nr:hypothetical protein [Niastella caeni]THU39647.1 hypothetical protein FAM09_14215 [Niastella caeni]